MNLIVKFLPNPLQTGKMPQLTSFAESLNILLSTGVMDDVLPPMFATGKILYQVRPGILQINTIVRQGDPITKFSFLPRDLDILMSTGGPVEELLKRVSTNVQQHLKWDIDARLE